MIYLEYDDGFNRPYIQSYSNWVEVKKALSLSDEGLLTLQDEGVFRDMDTWTLFTAEGARDRADYWSRVAIAIERGEEAPFS